MRDPRRCGLVEGVVPQGRSLSRKELRGNERRRRGKQSVFSANKKKELIFRETANRHFFWRVKCKSIKLLRLEVLFLIRGAKVAFY